MIYIFDQNESVRLDSYLSNEIEDMSRSHLQKLIKEGLVTVNDKKQKTSYMLSTGDIINVPEIVPDEVSIEPENIPLNIVYEDSDIVIVNKPKNMVVHPAAGHYTGTLVNAIMYHCRDSLSGINGELRPGIVHRIDKDTTGLLVICKNDKAHNYIAAQLSTHDIKRKYHALVYGNIKEDEGTINLPIDRSKNDRKKMAVTEPGKGRNAVTHFKVLERFPASSITSNQPATYIELTLETGRTHQIRVHMSYTGHPLAGDEVYGIKNDRLKGLGQYLHAKVLGFRHPSDGREVLFDSELPEYFENTLEKLRHKG